MVKAYLGKFLSRGPTPSVTFPGEFSGVFKDRPYYLMKESDGSIIITPYSIDELAEELGRDVNDVKRVVDKGTELLTFRHIKVDLEK